MKVCDLTALLPLEVFTGSAGLDKTVSGGYTSDLLSDVMGHAEEGMVWITMQTHRNIIAVASLKDVAAIIVVNGAKPDDDTLEEAVKEGVAILGTCEGAFETSGKLYSLLSHRTS